LRDIEAYGCIILHSEFDRIIREIIEEDGSALFPVATPERVVPSR
jgi:hypothetical protein